MSDERTPLLSDEQVFALNMRSSIEGGVNLGEDAPAYKVRDFYENLITTGKLRVVDCTYAEKTYGPVTYSIWNCSKHGELHRCKGEADSAVCLGCGNPIKR